MSGAAYLTTFQVQQRLSQVLTQMVSGEELPEDPCKYLAEKFRKLGAGESIEEEEVDAWKQPDVDERNEYMNEHRISIVVGVAINSLIAKLPYPENPFEASRVKALRPFKTPNPRVRFLKNRIHPPEEEWKRWGRG